jgi:hypothetical protein
MTQPNNAPSRTELIEQAIDKPTAGAIQVSTTSGLSVRDMGQAMEVAKLMSISGQAVPPHLRNNPGGCLAIALQGWEWGINPFAIANKSYVVNDRMCYESALYHAVVLRRAPIVGRLTISYAGKANDRTCTVAAKVRTDNGLLVAKDYTSPTLTSIQPRNSPLWKSDPDQQLFYYSVRAFARRHFPDVMMGVYTRDELEDGTIDAEPIQAPPKAKGPDPLLAKLGIGVTTEAPARGAAEQHGPVTGPGPLPTPPDSPNDESTVAPDPGDESGGEPEDFPAEDEEDAKERAAIEAIEVKDKAIADYVSKAKVRISQSDSRELSYIRGDILQQAVQWLPRPEANELLKLCDDRRQEIEAARPKPARGTR